MTDQVFIGTAADLARFQRTHDVLDAALLVETFPWWQRALAWLVWRTPVRRVVRRRFLSPYGAVRAILRPRTPNSSEAERAVQAQAAAALASDTVSGVRPDPSAKFRDGAEH